LGYVADAQNPELLRFLAGRGHLSRDRRHTDLLVHSKESAFAASLRTSRHRDTRFARICNTFRRCIFRVHLIPSLPQMTRFTQRIHLLNVASAIAASPYCIYSRRYEESSPRSRPWNRDTVGLDRDGCRLRRGDVAILFVATAVSMRQYLQACSKKASRVGGDRVPPSWGCESLSGTHLSRPGPRHR